jgi:hypothetical protein
LYASARVVPTIKQAQITAAVIREVRDFMQAGIDVVDALMQ